MSVIRRKVSGVKGNSTPVKSVDGNRVSAAVVRIIKNVDTQNWIYVSPKQNTWTIRKDGAHRVMRTYKVKSSAVSAAKRIINIANAGQVIIYNSQGEISKVI